MRASFWQPEVQQEKIYVISSQFFRRGMRAAHIPMFGEALRGAVAPPPPPPPPRTKWTSRVPQPVLIGHVSFRRQSWEALKWASPGLLDDMEVAAPRPPRPPRDARAAPRGGCARRDI